jgi:3-isopropylmalate dehydrogenase
LFTSQKKALNAIAVMFDHEFIFEDALMGAVTLKKTGTALLNKP